MGKMRLLPEHTEMVADKIRGYHIHNASGLVGITFYGDWLMHQNGFLARTSVGEWDVLPEYVDLRDEGLEAVIKNISLFATRESYIGLNKNKLYLIQWFETEKDARRAAGYVDRKKIWDCKEKKWM